MPGIPGVFGMIPDYLIRFNRRPAPRLPINAGRLLFGAMGEGEKIPWSTVVNFSKKSCFRDRRGLGEREGALATLSSTPYLGP